MFENFWRPRYREFCNRGVYERSCREHENRCPFCGISGCRGECRGGHRGNRCHHGGCECEHCRRNVCETHKVFIEGCAGGYRYKFDVCRK